MTRLLLIAALSLGACSTSTPTLSTSQGPEMGGSSLASLTSIRPQARPAHTPAEMSSRADFTPATPVAPPAPDAGDDDQAGDDPKEDDRGHEDHDEDDHDEDDHEDNDD